MPTIVSYASSADRAEVEHVGRERRHLGPTGAARQRDLRRELADARDEPGSTPDAAPRRSAVRTRTSLGGDDPVAVADVELHGLVEGRAGHDQQHLLRRAGRDLQRPADGGRLVVTGDDELAVDELVGGDPGPDDSVVVGARRGR